MNPTRAQRGFGIGGRAQLDLLRVNFMRGFDLFRIGIDKQDWRVCRLAANG